MGDRSLRCTSPHETLELVSIRINLICTFCLISRSMPACFELRTGLGSRFSAGSRDLFQCWWIEPGSILSCLPVWTLLLGGLHYIGRFRSESVLNIYKSGVGMKEVMVHHLF